MNEIHCHINQFIPFDVSEIFNLGDPVIFGGAVRDSIAKLPINDIDIISFGNTTHAMHDFLTTQNYKPLLCRDECWRHDTTETRCPICKTTYQIEWFDVITYFHIRTKYSFIANDAKDFRQIQLIRPKLGHFYMSDEGQAKGFARRRPEDMLHINTNEAKNFILNNVDLSCCGVFLDKNGLAESVEGAKKDCETKSFRVLDSAEFYHEWRTHNRIEKLKERSWKAYEE